MVLLAGWNGTQVGLTARHFSKPMGLATEGPRLALACEHELWLFADDRLLAAEYLSPGRYDALYLPRAAYFTGDLNIHDLGFGVEGLWLVNTRFSCLAGVSLDFSFVPRWQPRFITRLAPEDRCHLNGLALVEGRPKYVTALGESDQPGGWRANKVAGGVLIDVDSRETIARGLCMPHSPRWHDDQLWVLNSGTGELWTVDPQQGSHTVVCALPGFLRGLCFVGPYALVGLCRLRDKNAFDGLPVQSRVASLVSGVAVVDLRSGRQLALLEFTAGCSELYDVRFLPGVFRPAILNQDKPAVRQAITAPAFSYWLQPKEERT